MRTSKAYWLTVPFALREATVASGLALAPPAAAATPPGAAAATAGADATASVPFCGIGAAKGMAGTATGTDSAAAVGSLAGIAAERWGRS